MGKSLDFCLSCVTDSKRSEWADRNWAEAKEYESKDLFDMIAKEAENFRHRITVKAPDNKVISFDTEIVIDDEADFDYFTSSSSCHDGTAVFVLNNIERCISNVLNGTTFFLPKGIPEDKDLIRYTVGSFILLNEYNDNGFREEKNNLRQRTTVLLPIKYEKLGKVEF